MMTVDARLVWFGVVWLGLLAASSACLVGLFLLYPIKLD
jgi:hypothetical protein